MRAYINDLKGKYYGTEIIFYPLKDDQDIISKITVWIGRGEPSERELAKHGLTIEQWRNNEEINDGFGGTVKIREADIISCGHYESALSYDIAKHICNDLKGFSER